MLLALSTQPHARNPAPHFWTAVGLCTWKIKRTELYSCQMQTSVTASYKLSESNRNFLAWFGLLISTTLTFPNAADIRMILPFEALSGCLQVQPMNLATSKENLKNLTKMLGWGNKVVLLLTLCPKRPPNTKPTSSIHLRKPFSFV